MSVKSTSLLLGGESEYRAFSKFSGRLLFVSTANDNAGFFVPSWDTACTEIGSAFVPYFRRAIRLFRD